MNHSAILDHLRGEAVGVARALEHVGKDRRLRDTRHQEATLRGRVDQRGCERHAAAWGHARLGGHDPAVGLVDGGRAGEQRGRVAVLPHPEQHEVEPGTLHPRRQALRRAEGAPQQSLVLRGRLNRIRLTADPVHLPLAQRHVIEQCLLRHQVVAVRIERGDAPLVSPEHVDPVPVDALDRPGIPESFIEGARGRAARQRHIEPAGRVDRLRSIGHEGLGRGTRNIGRLWEHLHQLECVTRDEAFRRS